MVVLAAAVCTKSGRVLFSRQYVEMTRAGISGLLAAFTKRCTDTSDPDRQHTYIETENVRYLYQPMEELVMVIVTSKMSNIVDDLDTLHLYTKLVSTYVRQLNERCLMESVWDLISAFDEPITFMGYKEKVSIGQIKNFVEMDSHEEKMRVADMEEKIRNVQRIANEKANQFKEQREAAERAAKFARGSGIPMSGGSGGIPSPSALVSAATGANQATPIPAAYVVKDTPKPGSAAAEAPSSTKGMQLGKKPATAQSNEFLDQVAKEDRGFVVNPIAEPAPEEPTVKPPTSAVAPPVTAVVAKPAVRRESVHINIQEALRAKGVVEGIVDTMEVAGDLAITIADPKYAKLYVKATTNPKYLYNTHPQIDKVRFTKESGVIAAKDPNRPFPVGNAITVAKWRLQSKESLPVIINCFPSIFEQGITLNLECTVGSATDLTDIEIAIPCPAAPQVTQLEGEQRMEGGMLIWHIPLLDDDLPSGTIEFTCAGTSLNTSQFFPMSITYQSQRSLSGLEIEGVYNADNEPIPFSKETTIKVDSFTIFNAVADAQAS
ncbi:coatomer subunit delta [Pelomyxa schiedti]|nr:coatomer subunit delta [Pelomyxa schiedti]